MSIPFIACDAFLAIDSLIAVSLLTFFNAFASNSSLACNYYSKSSIYLSILSRSVSFVEILSFTRRVRNSVNFVSSSTFYSISIIFSRSYFKSYYSFLYLSTDISNSLCESLVSFFFFSFYLYSFFSNAIYFL